MTNTAVNSVVECKTRNVSIGHRYPNFSTKLSQNLKFLQMYQTEDRNSYISGL